MAISKSVLFDLGGFNPDSFGERWFGDGESGLNRKLWKNNMLVGYVPAAHVYHHIPPSRMTRAYLMKRMVNEGACTEYSEFRASTVTRRGLALRIPRIAFDALHDIRATLVDFLRRRDRSSTQLALNACLGMAHAHGRLAYIVRLWFHPELRELVERENWLAPTDYVRCS